MTPGQAWGSCDSPLWGTVSISQEVLEDPSPMIKKLQGIELMLENPGRSELFGGTTSSHSPSPHWASPGGRSYRRLGLSWQQPAGESVGQLGFP